jgi:pyruvate dehydrogenase E2 component (dihydrolipoyllysine-residue acetyltransferase)
MPIPITIPRLGWNMDEGAFVAWLKADGDMIRPGDRVFSLEGEKATEEIECLDSGILRLPPNAPKPGDRLVVGTVIAYLLKPGEPEPWAGGPATRVPPSVADVPRLPHPVVTPPPVASPAVRRLARERGIDLGSVAGSGPGGRIHADDLSPATATSSPRARRVAAELGIDWRGLRGTGRNGRVRERDVRAAFPSPPASGGEGLGVRGARRAERREPPVQDSIGPLTVHPLATNLLTPALSPEAGEREQGRLIPLTTTRRTIAARMLESLRATAPVTLTTTADATNLVNLRHQFKAASEGQHVPSYTDILVKLAAVALQKHPHLAARWTDAGLVLPDRFHIGIAVDTDAGLVVPVVRDVPSLDLRALAARTRELIDRARQGRLAAADMRGGCFTVSNLGAYGIDAFTPIINYPECAVLGVGRIARRPAVVGDAVVPRDQVTLSLTFDHRIVDGGPAARFLQTLAGLVEAPPAWLTVAMPSETP